MSPRNLINICINLFGIVPGPIQFEIQCLMGFSNRLRRHNRKGD